jgi:hypothetical protein
MLGHPSECTPMLNGVLLKLLSPCCFDPSSFVFNLKGLAINTGRIQVLQDAFVLTLQSYFFFLGENKEKRLNMMFLLGGALLEEWLQAL